jgi:hypothetical protein
MVNPYYFYGFDQIKKIENMYTGLQGNCSDKNMRLLEDRKSFLLGLSDKGKDGKNKIQICKDLADKYLEKSKEELLQASSK